MVAVLGGHCLIRVVRDRKVGGLSISHFLGK